MAIERPSLSQVFRATDARKRRAPARRAALLPKLAPAPSDRPEAAPAAPNTSTSFRDRPEASDNCAFLTVYALNAAIMMFAFPVGFGLLVFNILGGENLRTTAHVMGLTGLLTALPFLGTPVPFLT